MNEKSQLEELAFSWPEARWGWALIRIYSGGAGAEPPMSVSTRSQLLVEILDLPGAVLANELQRARAVSHRCPVAQLFELGRG